MGLVQRDPKSGNTAVCEAGWALTTERIRYRPDLGLLPSTTVEIYTLFTNHSVHSICYTQPEHGRTDFLLFRITAHMQYPWVGILFEKNKNKKTRLSYFLPLSISFLNRTSHKKLGRFRGKLVYYL